MATRKYGDPDNVRKKGEYHDPMPRWIRRSDRFKDLTGVGAKLLIELCARMDWKDGKVPMLTKIDLAAAVGFNRNCVSTAITHLAILGFITAQLRGKRHKMAIQVLFTEPDRLGLMAKATDNSFPISADVQMLEAPSDGRKDRWHKTPRKMATRARNDGVDSEVVPAWVADHDVLSEQERRDYANIDL